MMAIAIAVAFIVFSCKSKLGEAEVLDLQTTPLQVVDSMYMIQTKNGQVEMRVVTTSLQRFDNDTMSYEVFPNGINVYAYQEDGVLESTIRSDKARHESKKNDDSEVWIATGHVVIKNIVNKQTMETDTLYWDRKNKEIYTNSYIRMYSPDGLMQGYGMRSDERARNSIILRPFNSYSVVVQDTTKVLIDSVNFIGPLLKK